MIQKLTIAESWMCSFVACRHVVFSLAVLVAIEHCTVAATPVDEQLKNAVKGLIKQHKGEIGLAIVNLKSGEHYEFNADTTMPSASLIKLPMMVAAYRKSDMGELDLSKPVRLHDEDKVPGSGILTEHFSSGLSLPLRDYVRLMIRYSDNTATNIVADQLGLKTTAQMMESLGLQETKLHSKLYRRSTTVFPERSQQYGIGSTTAREMVRLLSDLHFGKLANDASTEEMRQHLLVCEDNTKIGAGLPTDVKYAHKTGAIANCRTDAGILYTMKGAVAVCFLSSKNEDQSWKDDNEANLLAAKIGHAIVQRFGTPSTDTQLREGAFGKIVEALQRTLNDRLNPSPRLSIDGDFGPATRAAVDRFQQTHKLAVTGVVDDTTWKTLGTLIEQDAPVPPPDVVNAQEQQLDRQPQESFAGPPIVTCKAWIIIDEETGETLFSHNPGSPLEAASTTKIMTAFLVTRYAEEHPDVLNETIQFSKRADDTVGSTSGLRAGERVSVRELLYGLLLPSGNDASVAFAEHFGARVANQETTQETEQADARKRYEQFLEAMNTAAEQMGMLKTQYMNPHGLSHENHLISAADLAKLSYEAMKNEVFRNVSRTRQFGCVANSERGYQRNILWKNTNSLLEIDGFTGVKTGTTSAAGACLVASGERDGDKLMAVVLGSSSSPARYADTRNLLRWAWQRRSAKAATK